MRRLPYLVRFFLAAPPTARSMTTAFAATTAASAAIVVAAPERAGAALLPVLLLQLFTVSSGFLVPARRGHYDILLAMGQPRIAIAVVHWMTSAAVGLGSCGVVAVIESLAGGGDHRAVRASGTLMAIGVVSTMPWAINVRLPRYAAAIAWLIVLLCARAVMPPEEATSRPSFLPFPAAEQALAFILYPPALVGRSLEGGDWPAAAILAGLATLSMAWALATVHRSDIPLEAAQ
jgi:hypothetical protein